MAVICGGRCCDDVMCPCGDEAAARRMCRGERNRTFERAARRCEAGEADQQGRVESASEHHSTTDSSLLPPSSVTHSAFPLSSRRRLDPPPLLPSSAASQPAAARRCSRHEAAKAGCAHTEPTDGRHHIAPADLHERAGEGTRGTRGRRSSLDPAGAAQSCSQRDIRAPSDSCCRRSTRAKISALRTCA
jgi:hypothetical protein